MATDLATLAAPDFASDVSTWVSWSTGLRIATPEQFQDAGAQLKAIKALQKEIEASYGPLKQKASEAHRAIVAEEKRQLAPLLQAEAVGKAAMLTYQKAEQEKAEAERRRLQAIADEKARKEREKAEQEAAKQRQIEAEARAKAEAARKAAEEASAAEKRRLLEQAAAAERKAAAAAAKVEAKEEEALAVVAPVVQFSAPTPKVAGISSRRTWKAVIEDQQAFLAFVFEAKRYELVTPNLQMLDALAKGMKEQAKIPGVRFQEVSGLAAKGA